MSKRSWQEAIDEQGNGAARKQPAPLRRNQSLSNGSPGSASAAGAAATDSKLPGVSRKVKACAACRKQKIKCIMQGEPPCQRCRERGLSCKLNKSLQTLMSEDARWKSSVTKDVSALYTSVEQMLQLLNLPPLPQLLTSTQDPAIFYDQGSGHNEANGDDDDDDDDDDGDGQHGGGGGDDWPNKVTRPIAADAPLSHVPIESLYQITGMRALRAAAEGSAADDQARYCKQLRDTDFISRGIIKLEDAEWLARYYLEKVDPYIWHICRPQYDDLESFRRRSPTLTAAVLTVAALHDTSRCHLYSTCVKEYKRLVANAMFERNIDMEYLRALVIGAYWLSDISWTLSGYAIRRASEFHLKQCYHHIADSTRQRVVPEVGTKSVTDGTTNSTVNATTKLQDAMDGIRVLYLLYVCDHQLSILYGRSSIMRDNETYITGWEAYIACELATDADRRIAGQICLMYLMNQMRERLGPEDVSTELPESALSQIAGFERDLDDWIARFSHHNPSQLIGNWPNKGAIMHYHWAKLYLQSYVLRGGNVIPDHFLENASAAVQAATAIINLLVEDEDAHAAIGFVPHHIHGMVAFAAMFLLKVATKHREQLFVDIDRFHRLIGGLANHFKQIDVGKDHLLHRMADGLAKMAESLAAAAAATTGATVTSGSIQQQQQQQQPEEQQHQLHQQSVPTVEPALNVMPDFGVLDANTLDFGDGALGLGMPFFDFEGTTLNGGNTPGTWGFP